MKATVKVRKTVVEWQTFTVEIPDEELTDNSEGERHMCLMEAAEEDARNASHHWTDGGTEFSPDYPVVIEAWQPPPDLSALVDRMMEEET